MKQKLRKEILEKSDSLIKEEIKEKSKIIKEKLFSSPEFKKAKTICFFVSFNSKVNTYEMIKESIDQGKTICVPIATDHKLILSKINNFDELNKKSKYGILEPQEINEMPKDNVDIIIVPGTVFDKEGHRIGYGKGYYDGLLKEYKRLSIGICFDLQIIDKVPRDEWDEQLDKVITEKGIMK